VFELILESGRRGLAGIALPVYGHPDRDPESLAEIMRRLLKAEGHQKAMKAVRAIVVDDAYWIRDEREVRLDVVDVPAWPRDGFSSLDIGRGITVIDMLASLRP
jgi:hypothetical protein